MKPQFSIIGFDKLFEQFDRQMRLESGPKYPPHDLVRLSDTQYEIRLAVAGFERSELDVELDAKLLRIKGAKIKKVAEDEPTETFIFNGISHRSFDRQFVLSDTVKVTDVTLVNGILTVKLEDVVTEDLKPKKFTVN